MFKLLMKHSELKDLTFSLEEYGCFLQNGDIRRPEAYRLVLRVKAFKKLFYINLAR